MARKESYAREVIKRLEAAYPDARIVLHFSSPIELLVAVILSAQSTDATVNRITPALFERYRTARDYAEADGAELESFIKPCGFYHNKAKNIIGAAGKLVANFGSELPRTMAEMVTLPGVARKTGNIVIYNTYGIAEGIAVDTHVRRISQRLGLSNQADPDKIEKDLMRLVPRAKWGSFNCLLVDFGRDICTARAPKHEWCVLRDICPQVAANHAGL